MKNNENLYEILKVKSDASSEEIKSNFRKLALIYHPDKNNNSEESQINFQIIYKAYETLTSFEKREKYDNYLKTRNASLNIKTEIDEKSIFNKRWRVVKKSENPPVKTFNKNETLYYLCSQYNFILWEIEDIINIMKKTPNDKIYSGNTIDQWIFKILNFIDKWALEPAGFPDYFYEARKIKDKRSSDFIQDGILNKSHKPYVSIEDYFYNIRKRINKFMNTINMSDFLKSIYGLNIRLIDSIIESQSMAYHYIGSLNLALKNESTAISPFFHSNKCYDDDFKELLK